MNQSTQFKVILALLIFWNLMGVFSFIGHMGMTGDNLAQLPEAEQALYLSFPFWVKVIFGIAVFTGLAGALALFFKHKVAINLFTISLVAVIIQMGFNLFFTDSVSYYGTMSIVFPVIVILLAVFALWYSRKELS